MTPHSRMPPAGERGASQQATETVPHPTAPRHAGARDGAYWAGWLDGRAVGLQAGWDRGFQARVELEAEQRARELLTEQASGYGAWAHREAEQRHGSAWAAMFEEAS